MKFISKLYSEILALTNWNIQNWTIYTFRKEKMNLFLRLKMNLFLRLKNYNFQNEFRALLENYLSETLRNPLDGVLYNDDLLLMIAQ